MNVIVIPVLYKNTQFVFNKWFGFLLKKENEIDFEEKRDEILSNKKVKDSYEIVMNPFGLQNIQSVDDVPEYTNYIKIYASIMVFLCKKSFILALLFSKIRLIQFNNAQDSVKVFRDIFPKNKQKDLCLPRSLFIAATSKKFKNSGVVFIGVFLPSRAMHAWVIEDNVLADSFDHIWICYQPIAILY